MAETTTGKSYEGIPGYERKTEEAKMTRLSQLAANKYHAVKTYSELCQRAFDSKAEAKRGEELALLERAGEIESLEYQHKCVLYHRPIVTITLDFRYKNKGGWEWIYEDAKGVLTRDFRTKLAWLKKDYGIEVKLIREGK